MVEATRNKQIRQVLVGLAGHIDHGKSSLVRQLTGAAVDRRPEEQRRGMTVDLGFAHFDHDGLRFALIDVPGHDRFVHNMVSGAVGVQAGMLVVAADDSVMPQTREHLAILDLLGVAGAVVVITKSDLVDAERLQAVRQDIAELIQETTFSNAKTIVVSNKNGSGITEVRHALVQFAMGLTPTPKAEGPFRLSIDRAFTLPGHGTIVTGTVRRGSVMQGESLHLLPQQTSVKVRQLQCQGSDVEAVFSGERAAVNLSRVKVDQVRRGDELVSIGFYQPTQRLLIRLRVLPEMKRGIQDREQVRVHIGTKEVTGRIRTPVRLALPGEDHIAVLDCAESVVAEFDQRLILRRLSPAETIGGGRVLSTHVSPNDRLSRLWKIGERLNNRECDSRLPAFLTLNGPTAISEISWPLAIGCSADVVTQLSSQHAAGKGALVKLRSDPDVIIATEEWDRLVESIHRTCRSETRQRYPQRWMTRSIFLHRFGKHYQAPIIECAIDELVRLKDLVANEKEIALADRVQLSARQQALLDDIESAIVNSGAAPPTLKELATQTNRSVNEIEPLVRRLVDDRQLVRVSEDLAVPPNVVEMLLDGIQDMLASQSEITVAEVRDRWQVTRKHALPYLQYFDEQGYTKRSGTVRVAGQRLTDRSQQNSTS